jgi:hypothetical protein
MDPHMPIALTVVPGGTEKEQLVLPGVGLHAVEEVVGVLPSVV